mmetsp:Transcript_66001/g.137477  ORF Transcript_66001/g.137477 Transcript_66001/m.137477 type:complete len:848 (+) Transcript_66001:73-2616(+)|eukprot:CAMPEP_0181326940 /NCGR_PEP_ID=MMETSP1101-20121128/21800_1 /TAXON_ID=46948 /ORGANISM="Rhodomonas abbreviata, Strain Caron Lab Isolate" /LENGTH=847 /DNA_ID=CAMNT_0023435495 /DNA_START=51 /DNA_END=2594 /DNA_ORIENTATION=+
MPGLSCAEVLLGSLAVLACLSPVVNAHRPHDVIAGLGASEDGRTLFAHVRSLTIKSEDGGETWDWAGNGLIESEMDHWGIHISPTYATDKIVFFAGGQGLWRSGDGGNTWAIVETGPDTFEELYNGVIFSPRFASDRIIFVSGQKNKRMVLMRSNNAGQTFVRVYFPAAPTTLLATDSALYAGSEEGNLYGTSDGATWTQIAAISSGAITSLAVVPNGPPALQGMLQHIQGATEHLLIGSMTDFLHVSFRKFPFRLIGLISLKVYTGDERLSNGGVISVHVSPLHISFYITALNENFVLRSRDEGRTWTQIGESQGLRLDPGNQPILFNSAAFKFVRPVQGTSTIFCAGFNGLLKSVNDGDSWGWVSTISTVLTGFSLACASADCNSFALSMCSYDEGCTRATVDKATLLDPAQDPMDSAKKEVTGQVANTQYTIPSLSPNFANDNLEFRTQVTKLCTFSTPEEPYICSNYSALSRSTDNFVTSVAVDVPVVGKYNGTLVHLVDQAVHTVIFSPAFVTDRTVFVSGFNLGVSKSTDGGNTFSFLWEVAGQTLLAISPNYPSDRTMACVVRPHQVKDVQDIAQTASIWWSINGGLNWTEVAATSGPLCADSAFCNGHMADWIDLAVWKPDDWKVPVVIGLAREGFLSRSNTFERGNLFITKDGATWKPLSMSEYATFRPLGLAMHTLELAPAASYGPSAEMIVAFSKGGARTGYANGKTFTLDSETQALPAINEVPITTKSWAFDFYPCKNKANRGLGRKIQYSPNYVHDGIIFGSSFYEIVVSVDRGVNWAPVFSVQEDGLTCDDPNCEICSYKAICLSCTAGYDRVWFHREGKELGGFSCKPVPEL